MDKEYYIVLALALAFIAVYVITQFASLEETVLPVTCSYDSEQSRITLPEPKFKGKTIEDAISERRSERNFSSENITLSELSMLLWAGNGITDEDGFRSAPSAGAIYPIDIYVIPNRVPGASCGVYRYAPKDHEIILVKKDELSGAFYNISYRQTHVRDAAVLLVLVSTPARTTSKYGEIGKDYVLIEAGHIAQNILLEGNSMGLKSVPVGGFDREKASSALGIDEKKETIYIIAAGR